jgi:hypothetical protein
MSDHNRNIEQLLIDYAGALRDGEISTFLKSLTRDEAEELTDSMEFPEAAEVARLLNSVHFAEKVAEPNVGLFMSRVDAKIASRAKQALAAPRMRRTRQRRLAD